MKNKFYIILLAFVASFALMSCSDDDPSSDTIFPTTSPTRDAFDKWLLNNYTYPYNVDVKYKMEDIESDHKYTLVPADSAADLGTAPADLIGCFNLIFYQSAEDAVYKALGVE